LAGIGRLTQPPSQGTHLFDPQRRGRRAHEHRVPLLVAGPSAAGRDRSENDRLVFLQRHGAVDPRCSRGWIDPEKYELRLAADDRLPGAKDQAGRRAGKG
jgi:hypothetical protein